MTQKEEQQARTGLEIAVIGMSGRFPGAKNLEEFWENLKNGVECNTFCTDEELIKAGADPKEVKEPNYVKSKGGILEGSEYFDAAFFDYVPGEAVLLNPQVRLFHECTWEALENAGYNPDLYEGSIGLYAGASSSFNWEARGILSGKANEAGYFAAANLMDKDFLSIRVCYKLNLRGPGITLNTACSTSLVTIEMACGGILTGLCNIAAAGGVGISALPRRGYLYREGMIHSPDGGCRAFDARAKGTFGGEGIGVVVLKLLEEAEADGDHIHAVIKGAAVNNDGSRKVGYTAPSVEGQAAVIRDAHHVAEIDPETITYVEAHGTGTVLGDPVEIEALKQGFGTAKRGYCAIGSVKTNMGHLDAAAGAAGFIKTVLALKHRQIPPSLHFEKPNPAIDFDNSPFYVNRILREWKNENHPLRAGVSAFGIGGTNAHVILEEYFNHEGHEEGREYQLVLLSAKTETALEQMSRNLAAYFKKNPAVNLADAAYTLQVGRKRFKYRRMWVGTDSHEIAGLLETGGPGKAAAGAVSPEMEKRLVVFMFSGLGSQYENMGLGLYRSEPIFRQEMDRCFDILKTIVDYDIKAILYPGSRGDKGGVAAGAFEIAQLEIFIFEYALAKLLIKWGITPDAMMGYSFGEYTAACIGGVFSLEDALRLIVMRGQLMRKIPAGAMLSVPLPLGELRPLLPAQLSLAIDNGPSCVVSGPVAAVDAFEKQMKEKRLLCMRLKASHAIHSQMMAPILKEFAEKLGQFTLNKPVIPYISNVSGDWIKYGDAVDPRYWAKHMLETVCFADGMKRLVEQPASIFVEIGPGGDLTALAARHIEEAGDGSPAHKAVNLVRQAGRDIPDPYFLSGRIGQVWLYGKTIDWKAFHAGENRFRIPLPTYPFEGRHFGLETGANAAVDLDKAKERMGVKKGEKQEKQELADWFYVPHWTRALPPGKQETLDSGTWLLFMDNHGFGEVLAKRLHAAGHNVVTVTPDETFQHPEDYNRLFTKLNWSREFPNHLVHLRSLSKVFSGGAGGRLFQKKPPCPPEAKNILNLIKAVSKGAPTHRFQLSVISDHWHEVTGMEDIQPGKSILAALLKVIPQEHANIRCRGLDIILPRPGSLQEEVLAGQLVKEMTAAGDIIEPVVAFRGHYRWVQTFGPLRLDRADPAKLPLRREGVYLITGGLGKIGWTLAKYLAGRFHARLVLTGRSVLPEGEKQGRIRQLEALGGKVLVYSADTADEERMGAVIGEVEQQWGMIHGVIHAAGITGGPSFSPLNGIGPAELEMQFHSKVYGTLVLEELFREKSLDFCWLMSSISTVLGGLGFGAYAAANAFMDGFVARLKHHTRGRWLSVDWDGMPEEETMEAFERILALGHDEARQVVVSAGGNLQQRIDRWIKLETLSEDTLSPRETAALHPRPRLLTPYVPPSTRVQMIIANTWKRIFGFEEIGIHDDFLELGGDSLKAITVIAAINRQLNADVPLVEFFNRPTVEMLAGYISTAGTRQHSVVQAVETREYYPLSSAQKRLYILQRLDKQSIAYNETKPVLLKGGPDREKLEKAFRRIIERHESLRTSIRLKGQEPVQQVHAASEIDFAVEYYDISTNKEKEKDIIKRFIRPFDLSQAPFFRVALIKREERQHIMLIDVHHIVTDGVSHDIFVRELTSLYWGLDLPFMRLQYRDYSEWLHSAGQRAVLARQEAFWLDRFHSGAGIPVLNLPVDYPRPAVQSFEGRRISFQLTAQETGALKKLAADRGATIYMVLLTIYYILLFKLSGQEDIIIGTPVVGRRHVDLENIMGIFINTLPLRNYPLGDKPVTVFFKEVKERILEDFENQDYPFEDLVDRAAVKRDTGRNPLFDTMFVLQGSETPPAEPPGGRSADLELLPYSYEAAASRLDLALEAFEAGEELLFGFEYSTRLLKPGSIRRFIAYFKQIVSHLLADPGKKLSEVEMLPEGEKKRLLFEFNATGVPYPTGKTIHGLFEEQASRTPDSPAVVLGSVEPGNRRMTSMSYRELSEKSGRLARRLQSLGGAAGDIAAVMMGRSLEVVIGMLGILKAGAAYLPIDADYPQERIKYMLADSGAKVLVTTRPLVKEDENVGIVEDVDTLFIDSLIGNPAAHPPASPPAIHANLAYIIYTSGSTGRPKGALIRHRGFINMVDFLFDIFGQGPGSRMSQVFNPGFDAMGLEVWTCLLKGAALYIVPDAARIDPGNLKRWLIENKITASFQSTAVALRLLEEEWPETGVALEVLGTGGDRLTHGPTRAYPFRFCNLYGLTEASVTSTWAEVEAVEDRTHTKAPVIGRPIANHQVYIIGPYFQLQPLNVPGELCIGGVGLAVGYLNRPELTAERFIVFYHEGHEGHEEKKKNRLYLTGDLARWSYDGDIEFLGRIDSQVKIRGFRIEPREIETRLLAHEHIKEAVVLAKRSGKGEQNLYAYVVPGSEDPSSLTVAQLKKYLLQQLPDYMVPSHFVPLEKMPFTPNGKIDKKALFSQETTLGTGVEYVPPENETEKIIAGIWKEVLDLDKVGIYDNFFDIGGNSMVLLKVSSKIQEVFKKEIPVVVLFQYTTVGSLAGYLDTDTRHPPASIDNLFDKEKSKEQVEALNEGKNRMKRFIRKSRETADD